MLDHLHRDREPLPRSSGRPARFPRRLGLSFLALAVPARALIPIALILAFVGGIALGGLGRTVASADSGMPTWDEVVPTTQRNLGVSPAALQVSPVAAEVQSSGTPVPADSGAGRRIVLAASADHVWLVNADESVAADLPASGTPDCLPGGTSTVISKSPSARIGAAGEVSWLVRVGVSGEGFHSAVAGGGCIGLAEDQARAVYEWASPGTAVVALA